MIHGQVYSLGENNSFGGLHIDVFGSAFWQYVIDGRKEWHIMSPVVDFPADYSFFEEMELNQTLPIIMVLQKLGNLYSYLEIVHIKLKILGTQLR